MLSYKNNSIVSKPFYSLGFVCDQTYIGNEGYVSAVAVGGCSDNFPSGSVITGCQDGKIRVYNPGAVNPTSILTGHTDTGWLSFKKIFVHYFKNGFLLF